MSGAGFPMSPGIISRSALFRREGGTAIVTGAHQRAFAQLACREADGISAIPRAAGREHNRYAS